MRYKIFILLSLTFLFPLDDVSYATLADNYEVEILRDTWGVPHIYGITDKDVAFGFAYAHSEDDFKTIQDVMGINCLVNIEEQDNISPNKSGKFRYTICEV